MKLNKSQKRWIARLKSGKTRKAKGVLVNNKDAMCCLGVGIECQGEEFDNSENSILDPSYYPKTAKALRLKGEEGKIDLTKVNEKWLKFFSRRKGLQSSIKNGYFALATLNDVTTMSHVQIGQFIEENPEAVFRKRGE